MGELGVCELPAHVGPHSSLDRWPGLTQDQLSEITGLLRSAVAGRCNRLERLGFIKKDGTRLTRYGRPAAVYVLTEVSA